jgi:hypothetical protein
MTNAEGHGADLQTAKGTAATPEDRRRQWEEHVTRWQSSGLTQVEYCRSNELKCSTFYYWKKRLAPPSTTEINFVQVPVGFNTDGRGCWPCQELVLTLGSCYKVEIGDNFKPSTLARLVETLGQL